MIKPTTALFVLLTAFLSCSAGDGAPFAMPTRARVVETTADGRGWTVNGEIPVSFTQARAQLAAKASASGWAHLHTISLGRDRVLEAWSRGAEELTLMVWRITAGRSGFSYGLSSKAGSEKSISEVRK